MAETLLQGDRARDNVIPFRSARPAPRQAAPPSGIDWELTRHPEDFDFARKLVEEARLRYQYLICRDYRRYLESGTMILTGEQLAAFADLRALVLVLAEFPISTKRDQRIKRAAIGTWLDCRGDEYYDRLRACVAADDVRIGAKKNGVAGKGMRS